MLQITKRKVSNSNIFHKHHPLALIQFTIRLNLLLLLSESWIFTCLGVILPKWNRRYTLTQCYMRVLLSERFYPKPSELYSDTSTISMIFCSSSGLSPESCCTFQLWISLQWLHRGESLIHGKSSQRHNSAPCCKTQYCRIFQDISQYYIYYPCVTLVHPQTLCAQRQLFSWLNNLIWGIS